MKNRIWTEVRRRVLYSNLVRKFGPCSSWEKATSPGKGRDQEYQRFLAEFAKHVGAKSAEAVAHQIAFSKPIRGIARWEQSQAITAVLNLAAAFNAGFITQADIPDLIATRPKPRRRVSKTSYKKTTGAHEAVRP